MKKMITSKLNIKGVISTGLVSLIGMFGSIGNNADGLEAKIAYNKYRDTQNIFIANEDGTGEQKVLYLPSGGVAATDWLNEDTLIINRGYDIFSVKIDGSNLTPLAAEQYDDGNQVIETYGRISPDLKKIVYTRISPYTGGW